MMPEIKLEYKTRLLAPEVKKRTNLLIADFKRKYSFDIHNFRKTWAENMLFFSLMIRGLYIRGEVTVRNNLIKVKMIVPLGATLHRIRIREEFLKMAEKLFP